MLHLIFVILIVALVVWGINYLFPNIDAFFKRLIYVVAVLAICVAAFQIVWPMLGSLKIP